MNEQQAIERAMRSALLPQKALELLNRSRDPRVSNAELARIIGSDQVIAARMLKIANSAFYGKAGKIGTIQQALLLLGRETLISMILGLSMRQALNPDDPFERTLWEHSVCSARAARLIAQAARYPALEEAYLAGLLHSLGVLILARALSKERALAIFSGQENRDEQSLALVIARLGEWGLPPAILRAMAEWMGAQSRSPDLVHITALACTVSRRLGVGPIVEPDANLAAHSSAARLGLDAATLERILTTLGEEYRAAGGNMDNLL